jgi:hypothetical protein
VSVGKIIEGIKWVVCWHNEANISLTPLAYKNAEQGRKNLAEPINYALCIKNCT